MVEARMWWVEWRRLEWRNGEKLRADRDRERQCRDAAVARKAIGV